MSATTGVATSTVHAKHASAADAPTALAPILSAAGAVLALTVALFAALTLAGALAEAEPLQTWGLGEEVPASTALALLLIAAATLLARRPRTRTRRIAARVLATSALLSTGLILAQDLASSWIIDDPGGGAVPALGWMAPNSAIALVLLGLAVALVDVGPGRRRWPLHEPLALLAQLIAFLALLGYLYRVAELYWMDRATVMSLATSIAILVLGTSVVLLRLDRGVGGLLASDGLGGAFARRLIPAAVLIPTLLGLLRLVGQRNGLYDTELGTTLLIAATVIVFSGVTAWSSSALGRVDAARRRTVHALSDESFARELERRRLRAVLDVLPVAVFISDSTGRFVDASREARAIWGEDLPSHIGEPGRFKGWNAKTGEALGPGDWAIARALDAGVTCGGQATDILTFDGRRKTILNHAAPIRDERGQIVGAVSVSVDITEQKRAERELAALKDELEERVRERTAELVAANAELEAFSYSVSHDLRAPLRWIDGFTRALVEDHGDELGEDGREYLRQLHESVERMTQLIDALLWLSRVTMRPIDRDRIDLGAIARELASGLEEEEPKRKVEWAIDDVVVTGDGRLLRVLLDNLLRNAWKFTRPRATAHIEVGAETRNGELVCFVRDDGVGFEEGYADRLFRPFERLHAHEEYEGTGIGLALVRRIVVRHGGRVWAESRPNEGATFYFTLAPRRPA